MQEINFEADFLDMSGIPASMEELLSATETSQAITKGKIIKGKIAQKRPDGALIDIGYKGTFNFETNVPVKTVRYSFEYQGEIVRKLEKLPMDLVKQIHTLLYNIGKHMLETYDIYEA